MSPMIEPTPSATRIQATATTNAMLSIVPKDKVATSSPAKEASPCQPVWESRDHFDRFAGSRLMPAVQELGDRAPAGQPDITEFPVHHFTKP